MIKCLTQKVIPIELEFGNVGFLGEGKTGVAREKPLGARTRTNNELNPHTRFLYRNLFYRISMLKFAKI